jgi:hypothetical protein
MVTTTVRTLIPRVSSNLWETIFLPIGRRLRGPDRFYQAQQHSQYLTYPFVY